MKRVRLNEGRRLQEGLSDAFASVYPDGYTYRGVTVTSGDFMRELRVSDNRGLVFFNSSSSIEYDKKSRSFISSIGYTKELTEKDLVTLQKELADTIDVINHLNKVISRL